MDTSKVVTPPDFSATFVLGTFIAAGAVGSVFRCTKRDGGAECAVKLIDTRKMGKRELAAIRREVANMQSVLDHPHLMTLQAHFESPGVVALVTDIAEGGELFSFVAAHVQLAECVAAHIVGQVAQGLAALHGAKIAHRDLKPENVLLMCPVPDRRAWSRQSFEPASFDPSAVTVRIADFGLSKQFSTDVLQTRAGTLDYMAPEIVLAESHTEAVDLWSLGVLTFVLLAAKLPFYSSRAALVFEKISTANYSTAGDPWPDVDPAAIDFIAKLIRREASERMRADEVAQHKWISSGGNSSSDSSSCSSGGGARSPALAAIRKADRRKRRSSRTGLKALAEE